MLRKKAAAAVIACSLIGAIPVKAVTLAWDPVADSRVGLYKISYGTSSGAYTNFLTTSSTTIEINNLAGNGVKYYAAAQACTGDLTTCSAYSNEVQWTQVLYPQPPTNLRLSQ